MRCKVLSNKKTSIFFCWGSIGQFDSGLHKQNMLKIYFRHLREESNSLELKRKPCMLEVFLISGLSGWTVLQLLKAVTPRLINHFSSPQVMAASFYELPHLRTLASHI